jgi:hypothetical protein
MEIDLYDLTPAGNKQQALNSGGNQCADAHVHGCPYTHAHERKKKLLILRIISRAIFIQIKHPLAIGIILLLQTLLTCLIRGIINKRF